MSSSEVRHPNVFISYSHDSPEHADHVLALSDRLRADGIDCVLDQYELSPPEGFPRWMDRQIRAADFVLMICTPTYFTMLELRMRALYRSYSKEPVLQISLLLGKEYSTIAPRRRRATKLSIAA